MTIKYIAQHYLPGFPGGPLDPEGPWKKSVSEG